MSGCTYKGCGKPQFTVITLDGRLRLCQDHFKQYMDILRDVGKPGGEQELTTFWKLMHGSPERLARRMEKKIGQVHRDH